MSNYSTPDAKTYKGNDIDPDGDGQVADADTVDGVDAGELGSTVTASGTTTVSSSSATTIYEVGDETPRSVSMVPAAGSGHGRARDRLVVGSGGRSYELSNPSANSIDVIWEVREP